MVLRDMLVVLRLVEEVDGVLEDSVVCEALAPRGEPVALKLVGENAMLVWPPPWPRVVTSRAGLDGIPKRLCCC